MFMMWLSEWLIASDFYCSCCIFLHFPKFQHWIYIANIMVRKKELWETEKKNKKKKEPLLTMCNWAFLIPRLSQAPHRSSFSFCSLYVSITFLLSHLTRKRNQLLHNSSIHSMLSLLPKHKGSVKINWPVYFSFLWFLTILCISS